MPGEVHILQTKYTEAEEEIESAFRLMRDSGREDGCVRALCLDALAEVYCRKGEFTKARAPAEEACNLNRSLFGPEHKRYACSLTRLAQACESAGDYREAKERQQAACEILTGVLGKDHGTTGGELGNLGLILLKLGEYPEAIVNLEYGYSSMVKRLGEKHINCGACLMNLAAAYGLTGNFQRAAQAFEEAAGIAETESEMMYVYAKVNLATALFDMGKLSESENILCALRASHLETLQMDPYIKALALQTAGQGCRERGEYEQAEAFLTEALAGMTEAKESENHPDVATLHSELGRLHALKKSFSGGSLNSRPLRVGLRLGQGAQESFERARDIRGQCLGESHRAYSESLTDLGMLCCATGKVQEAVDLLLKASQMQLESLDLRRVAGALGEDWTS